jgi:ribosome-associated heat shock protein Hsp15
VQRQRLDKWLWHARVVRTRSAAVALTTSGQVRVNGQRIGAPSHPLRAGDVVTVALDRSVQVLKVLGFSERRDPPGEARGLREILDSSWPSRTSGSTAPCAG